MKPTNEINEDAVMLKNEINAALSTLYNDLGNAITERDQKILGLQASYKGCLHAEEQLAGQRNEIRRLEAASKHHEHTYRLQRQTIDELREENAIQAEWLDNFKAQERKRRETADDACRDGEAFENDSIAIQRHEAEQRLRAGRKTFIWRLVEEPVEDETEQQFLDMRYTRGFIPEGWCEVPQGTAMGIPWEEITVYNVEDE
jgi:hypothetical protein